MSDYAIAAMYWLMLHPIIFTLLIGFTFFVALYVIWALVELVRGRLQ